MTDMIAAALVRALFNLLNTRPGSLAWEPFAGSGTPALEASLLGINCVATDLSPLCVLLTRVKVRSAEAVVEIRARVAELLKDPTLNVESFDPEEEPDERVREFIQIARMVTFSDSARRGRESAPWFRRNLASMLESVEAHARAISESHLRPGKVISLLADAGNLSTTRIEPGSVETVVTSPPYSIALDYVKNDEPALEALEADIPALRKSMTGVRGRAHEKLELYNQDMRAMYLASPQREGRLPPGRSLPGRRPPRRLEDVH